MSLNGKLALVTGGGRGIGRAICLRLAEEGADVAVADISLELAEGVADEVEELGRSSMAIKVDVSIEGEVKEMVRRVVDRFGKVDLLYNNAGIALAKPFTEVSEREWDEIFGVNVKGVFLCTREVARSMIERRAGRIVNIVSVAGKRGMGLMSAYCASKFAVVGFTQSVAYELARYGISVNAIAPGVIDTEMWVKLDREFGEHLGLKEGEFYRRQVEGIPLGRAGRPEDVAAMAAFLASEDASYLTGQTINVCGGRCMH
ncbi:MAG: SDR family NAD(P)-dependent oxidoreductase [bacterium]